MGLRIDVPCTEQFLRNNYWHGKSTWDRFWEKVDVRGEDECWEWKGSVVGMGYGDIHINNAVFKSHRVSWVIHFGEIPEGLEVCHKCDNPPCVNPNHFFLGTDQDNVDDMMNKGRGPHLCGEKNPASKLSSEKVIKIRQLRKQGMSGPSLGKMFGVSKKTIYYICNGKIWGHIKEGL